jgi:NAD+ kinase
VKNFGIFFNPYLSESEQIFELLEKINQKKHINLYKTVSQKEILPDFIKIVKQKQDLDYILVFGGDGTILRAVEFAVNHKAPILGINLGKLGFLTESSISEFFKSIEDVMNNKYSIQERMMLNIALRRNKEKIYSARALNDAVIYKGQEPTLIDIKIYCNDRFVLETRCDGVIAATPTGSTAYSLSAGGPILSQVMEAIVISPINPHILSVRPMVFSAKDKLRFVITRTLNETILNHDGQNSFTLNANDEVIITASSAKVSFIKLSNRTFFQILRKKLHMGKQ